MLAKKTRISRQKDFDYIFKNGRVYRGKFMVLRVAPNINDISRFAIIVSKKISNRATVRNLAKRRIKNIISGFYGRMIGKVNIVVSLKYFKKEIPFVEIHQDLEELMIRAKILKKNV